MRYIRFASFYTLAMFIVTGLHAQVQQKVDIQQATVFLKGAELTSTAKINLAKGESEILFTNIAGNVNQQSITVGADGNAVVESATFQNNYLAPKNFTAKAKTIKDSIDALTDARQQAESKMSALDVQLSIIDANKTVAGQNTGLNVAELQHLLDLVSTKTEVLLNSKNALQARIKKMDNRLADLNNQLDEEQKKGYQPGGQLLVKFYTDDATAANVVITYVTPNAGWVPAYDIRVDKVGDPVKLLYKAGIYQNSGVGWNDVRLVLSTGNPNEGVTAPQLNPVYLAFYTPPVEEMANAPMSKSTVMAYKVPLVDRYSPGGNNNINSDGIDQHVTVDNAGINTAFNIDLPYSIPTDGQDHMVAIKTYTLPATYNYYAVPKLDKDVFLQAHVTNWDDLNLLPGKTSIFYEQSYVGQGYIDTRNVKDTMNFSLGRDKKIIVLRDIDKQLRSAKTIGSNVRKTFSYTISVRNTRKQPVTVILYDQLPVSNDKDIVMESTQTEGAAYNETTGEVKWNLDIAAGETKKVALGYTVKYPKDKIVLNLGN